MAIRSRVVRPDTVIDTFDGGQMVAVSREAVLQEVVAAVETLLLCGGEFTVSSQRASTGFANESVSVAAFITWRNHSQAKPQPEPHVQPQVVEPPAEPALEEPEDWPEADEAFDRDEQDAEAGVPTAVH